MEATSSGLPRSRAAGPPSCPPLKTAQEEEWERPMARGLEQDRSVLAELAGFGPVLFQAGRPVHLWNWSLSRPVWLPLWRLSSLITGREPAAQYS